MSEKEEYARLMRKSLADNAHERTTYIKMALDTISDAGNASEKEVLDMTQEIVKATFRGGVGTTLAISIASGVRLQRTSEYKDSIRQAKANPPASSSYSSSSSAGPSTLGKQAIIDAALTEEQWRLEPTLKKARLHDRSVTISKITTSRSDRGSSTRGSPTVHSRSSKRTCSSSTT